MGRQDRAFGAAVAGLPAVGFAQPTGPPFMGYVLPTYVPDTGFRLFY
jgi:hypothetical protein